MSYNPPPIQKPEIKIWKNEPTQTHAAIYSEKWWETFNDKALNALEEKALQNNLTLQLAVAHLKEAEGIYITTRAQLMPQFNLFGFANRQRISQSRIGSSSRQNQQTTPTSSTSTTSTIPTTPSSGATGTESSTTTAENINTTSTAISETTSASVSSNYFSQIQLTPQMSYEIDFWGKYLNATRAALEQIKSNEAALKTAQLMITTEVALRYFELQSLDAEIDVLNRTIEIYKTQLNLNKTRYESGLSSDLASLQNEFIYQKLIGDTESTIQSRAICENLLATAIGMAASQFHVEKQKFNPAWIEPVLCLPMEILEKRPDIQELYHLVESQRLNVGVAKSLFFPSVVLTGQAGYQADKFSQLFKWKNRVLSGTASLFAPIFEGGRLYGQYEQAKAQYEATVAQYLDQVIVAFQEVESSLAVLNSVNRQYQVRLKEYESAVGQKEVSWESYQRGLVDYFIVIVADQSLFSAENALIQAKRDQVFAAINLIKSLGGGWKGERCKNTPSP